MHEYYEVLRRRKRLPVLPIAILLKSGAAGEVGLGRGDYVERTLGEVVLTFRYWQIALPDISAAQLPLDNPVRFALAPLLKDRQRDPVRLVRDALLGAAGTERDPSRQLTLAAFLEHYVPLTTEQRLRVEQELGNNPTSEVNMLLTSWHKAGIEEGREEGREEGKLDGVRFSLITILENRMGVLPREVYQELAEIQSLEMLQRLLLEVVPINTLAELRAVLPSGTQDAADR